MPYLVCQQLICVQLIATWWNAKLDVADAQQEGLYVICHAHAAGSACVQYYRHVDHYSLYLCRQQKVLEAANAIPDT